MYKTQNFMKQQWILSLINYYPNKTCSQFYVNMQFDEMRSSSIKIDFCTQFRLRLRRFNLDYDCKHLLI